MSKAGLKYVIRSLSQKPAFAVAAALTIALGIGSNLAVYAVVHAVLLAPLPFRNPEKLVQVWETHPDLHNLQVSVPDYLDWKKYVKTLELAAYTFQAVDKATLSGQGEPIAVQGTHASTELFTLLGMEPLVGHLYTSKDGVSVALISEQLWRRKFSSDPLVAGRTLRLGSNSYTIAGVLARKNAFPVWADVWMPLAGIDPTLLSTRKYHPLEVIGRLRPGFSLLQAQLELETTSRRLSEVNPATNGKIGANVVGLMETVTGEVRPALLAAWLAVGLVLLIAYTNLAHLMMGRALDRKQEIAVRRALGASRTAILRVFFAETVFLSVFGGALGVLAAKSTLSWIERLAGGEVPRLDGAGLAVPELGLGVLAAIVIAVILAAPSYAQVFRANLSETISSGGARGSSIRGSRLSTALMSSEVAFSFAVLLAAIVLVRSFALTLQTPPGFQADGVLSVHTAFVDSDWQKSFSFFRGTIAPALEATPGVREVAAVNSVPMSLGTTEHSRYATRFGVAGKNFEPGHFPTAQTRWCTPGYFHVLGIPLIRGRFLNYGDYNQPRYLINETFARRFFPKANAVGQKLLMNVVGPHPETDEIVGVVGDVREFGLTSDAEPAIYSIGVSPEMEVVVKAAAINSSLTGAIASTIRRLNPEQAIGPVRPLTNYIATSLTRQKFVLTLIGVFAGLAICLCFVGIYGVFQYSVSRRMREFGIRSAVGAASRDLLGHVMRDCVRIIVPGIAVGGLISAVSTRAMHALVYRISPLDPLSWVLTVICLAAFCCGAAFGPAARAARVDPAVLLREQ